MEPAMALIGNLRREMNAEQSMYAYTNGETLSILEESGFVGEKIIDMSDSFTLPISMIIARKVDK